MFSQTNCSLNSYFPNFKCNTETCEESVDLCDEWRISFEQFARQLQGEPELCQFFAEMDRLTLEPVKVVSVLINTCPHATVQSFSYGL